MLGGLLGGLPTTVTQQRNGGHAIYRFLQVIAVARFSCTHIPKPSALRDLPNASHEQVNWLRASAHRYRRLVNFCPAAAKDSEKVKARSDEEPLH